MSVLLLLRSGLISIRIKFVRRWLTNLLVLHINILLLILVLGASLYHFVLLILLLPHLWNMRIRCWTLLHIRGRDLWNDFSWPTWTFLFVSFKLLCLNHQIVLLLHPGALRVATLQSAAALRSLIWYLGPRLLVLLWILGLLYNLLLVMGCLSIWASVEGSDTDTATTESIVRLSSMSRRGASWAWLRSLHELTER